VVKLAPIKAKRLLMAIAQSGLPVLSWYAYRSFDLCRMEKKNAADESGRADLFVLILVVVRWDEYSREEMGFDGYMKTKRLVVRVAI
jgi:hypothetical protein